MFLKTQGMPGTAPATPLKPRGAGSKSNSFYFLFLPSALLYLTPAMFTNPVVATRRVLVDCNGLYGAIRVTWGSNPVIDVLPLKRQV